MHVPVVSPKHEEPPPGQTAVLQVAPAWVQTFVAFPALHEVKGTISMLGPVPHVPVQVEGVLPVPAGGMRRRVDGMRQAAPRPGNLHQQRKNIEI